MLKLNSYKKIFDSILSLTDKDNFDKKCREIRNFIEQEYIHHKITKDEYDEIMKCFNQIIAEYEKKLNNPNKEEKKLTSEDIPNNQSKEGFEKEYTEFIKNNTINAIPIYKGKYGKTAPERENNTKVVQTKYTKQIDETKQKGER